MAASTPVSSQLLQVKLSALETEWKIQKHANFFSRNQRREDLRLKGASKSKVGQPLAACRPPSLTLTKITPARQTEATTPAGKLSVGPKDKSVSRLNVSRFSVINDTAPSVFTKKNRFYGYDSSSKKAAPQKENLAPSPEITAKSTASCECADLGKRCLVCLSRGLEDLVAAWSPAERQDKRLVVQGLALISQGLQLSRLSTPDPFCRRL